jgi:adenosylcobinamide-phosphate synthase
VSVAVPIAVALAAALEAVVGEPPEQYHPVALLGRAVAPLESSQFGPPRLAGAVYAVAVPTATAAAVYGAVRLLAAVPPAAGAAAGLVLWVSTSLRLLLERGRAVLESSDDPERAREALPALVGRDVGSLSPGQVRSAAVESVAENFSDGFLAPLFAFSVFAFVSIPAAAAAAAFLKAANTMDSMFGYPGPFGWGSARLDDLLMFVPARLSALALALAAGDPGAPGRARRYTHKPASPNAGWPMGTLAAALYVTLEKPGAYVLNDLAGHPTVAEGHRALAVVRRAGVGAYALALLAGVVRWL